MSEKKYFLIQNISNYLDFLGNIKAWQITPQSPIREIWLNSQILLNLRMLVTFKC